MYEEIKSNNISFPWLYSPHNKQLIEWNILYLGAITLFSPKKLKLFYAIVNTFGGLQMQALKTGCNVQVFEIYTSIAYKTAKQLSVCAVSSQSDITIYWREY